MVIKVLYNKKDDILTIYNPEIAPTETIEYSEFLNIDITEKGITGLEIFYASEFLSLLNNLVTKQILESINSVEIKCKNFRNNLFMVLIINSNNQTIKIQLPPLKKSEYNSPLITNCE